ncbi:hypothetical protein ON010_g11218 [Phytophthora cinnamomi]|nr:hypothetical protein ON010_g11218 [Phytophthora cinnamomi]
MELPATRDARCDGRELGFSRHARRGPVLGASWTPTALAAPQTALVIIERHGGVLHAPDSPPLHAQQLEAELPSTSATHVRDWSCIHSRIHRAAPATTAPESVSLAKLPTDTNDSSVVAASSERASELSVQSPVVGQGRQEAVAQGRALLVQLQPKAQRYRPRPGGGRSRSSSRSGRRARPHQTENRVHQQLRPSRRVRVPTLRREGARRCVEQQRTGRRALRGARVDARADLQGRQLPLPSHQRAALHERALPPGHSAAARGLHRARPAALQALHRGRGGGRLLRATAPGRPVGRPPRALRGGQALQHPLRSPHRPRAQTARDERGRRGRREAAPTCAAAVSDTAPAVQGRPLQQSALQRGGQDCHARRVHGQERQVPGDSISKVVSIQDLARKSVTASDPSRKTVKFEEVVEAKPPPREGKACIYEEEDVPECGVFLPKQVLFRRGKRRVSGATLFSLVHVPSSSNLSPVAESPSTSESSSSSYASTASVSSSSSQEQENWSETKPPPVPPRPKATAPTLRAVPVEFPSKAVFHKGRATTAAC